MASDLAGDGRIRHGLFFAHLAPEKILKAHVCKKVDRSNGLARAFRQIPIGRAISGDARSGTFQRSGGVRNAGGEIAHWVGPEIIAMVRTYLKKVQAAGIAATRGIIFGSYARGAADSDSDSDLVVSAPEFYGNRDRKMTDISRSPGKKVSKSGCRNGRDHESRRIPAATHRLIRGLG